MNSVARIRGRAVEWIGTAILAGAALRYWLWYFNRSTNLLDEGSTAAQALRVVHGELIYRDFFTVVTPGSYYTIAWLFRLFGESLILLRWTALVTGMLVLIVTFVVARRMMAWPFAAAAALMTTVWGWFLVTPNYYSLQAAFLALAALACYARAVDVSGRRAAWLVLVAGVMTGCAAMVKQNVGAYAAVALLTLIWASRLFDSGWHARARLRTSAVFAAGIASIVLPVVLFLIIAGAGPYLYESWIYYPLVNYPERFSLQLPPFQPVLAEHGVISLADAVAAIVTQRVPEPAVFELWVKLVVFLPALVLPLAVIGVGVHAYRWHAHNDASAARDGHVLLAITLAGGLLLLQSWPRADVAHILFGLQPTFILFAYLLQVGWRVLSRLPGPRPIVQALALVISLAPMVLMLWNGYRRTDWEYANYVAHLRSARAAGIATVPIEAHRIDHVTRYITEHTSPDQKIFVVPWAAGFYFLADRGNATRTDFMLFEDPEAYPCLLRRLEEQAPKYVVYGYTWDVDGKRFRDYAAPVDRYIRSRYAIENGVDGYEIWRRLDDRKRPAGADSGGCQPRRFRWRDLFGRGSESASETASSVQ